jgi:hypothetical protein
VKLSRTPPSERKRIKTEVKLLKVRTHTYACVYVCVYVYVYV